MNAALHKEFQGVVGELLTTPSLLKLKEYRHHHGNRYEHTLRVAKASFFLAKKLHLDAKAAARGAALHDLFYHDKTCRPKGYHGPAIIRHPEEAARNAQALCPLSGKEKNIILSHMWPMSRHLPRSREAWLVDMVDTAIAIYELSIRTKKEL